MVGLTVHMKRLHKLQNYDKLALHCKTLKTFDQPLDSNNILGQPPYNYNKLDQKVHNLL